MKGEYELAEKYFEEAIASASAKGKKTRMIRGFHYITPTNLALAHLMLDKADEAKSVQVKALQVYNKSNIAEGNFIRNHSWYQTMQMHLGLAYMQLNRFDSAENCLKIAYDHNFVRQQQKALSARMLARLYVKQSNFELALEYYKFSLNVHVNFLDLNFFHFSERERADLYNEVNAILKEFNAFATQYSTHVPEALEDMYNYQLLCKSILFYSSRDVAESILSSGNEQLIAAYGEWKRKKDFLFRVYQMTDEEKDRRKIDQFVLAEELNDLEKELAEKSQAAGSGFLQKRKTWRDIEAKLLPGEAAIEMVRIENNDEFETDEVSYAALLVTPTSDRPILIILKNGDELEGRALNYYRNYIKAGTSDPYLYEQYWEKIAENIGHAKIVYFAPDGVYNKINLNTLYNSRTKKYLIEEIELRTVMNTKDLLSRTQKTEFPDDVYLFGFPDYDSEPLPREAETEKSPAVVDSLRTFFSGGRISKLPGTKTEILNIESGLSEKIGVIKYMGVDASEINLKELKSPEVVHIATHGFFLEDTQLLREKDRLLGITPRQLMDNPLFRSGLLLAGAQKSIDGMVQGDEDGVLTSYEAMNLQFHETNLVVLSACETGLGDVKNGEGVYGLQRAFQAAGAKAVLMSLWKVDDQASQELMATFYRQWLITGDKQSAFISAQKTLMKKYKTPFFWGAFVMMGE